MIVGRAAARVGLLGNPSDGYGGRVIAMTLPRFEAQVSLTTADDSQHGECQPSGCQPSDWQPSDSELLDATVTALQSRRPELVAEPGRFVVTTSIPRQVGLAGSSAIIIAALRALAVRAATTWDPTELARTALEVETDVLGWAAGPQDRVVQAYEGLLDMDFAEPWQSERYERLDPGLLPALFVAWSQSAGESSDIAHTNVRQRWLDGDTAVHRAMTGFAELAAAGRASLNAGTASDTWPELLDEAFELRSRFWPITEVDTALAATGRRAGAGVALAGSGGAVVGAVHARQQLEDAGREYAAIDAGFLVVQP